MESVVDYNKLNGVDILVTGSSGFIGKHLVKKLKSYGAHVAELGRDKCDITMPTQMEEWIEHYKPKIIYHLAASLDKTASIEYLMNINVKGTFNVLRAAKISKVDKVILMGTFDDANEHSAYGVTKQMTYTLGRFYSQYYDVAVLRPSIIYGPGQKGGMFIPAMMKSIIDGNTFNMSLGLQKRNFVYIDDVVDALINASLSEVPCTPIDICSESNISLLDIVEIMEELEPNFKCLTKYPMRVGELMDISIDTIDAASLFGWNAKTDIKTGLKKTMEWWLQNDKRT